MGREFTLHSPLKVYLSESLNPEFNLSIEEWLMDHSNSEEIILFLWQNKNTVVIGRNQNPYKECNLRKLKEDQVTLIRRLSGGGAVYHDLGNLNFTFIASDKNYNIGKNMQVIIDALESYGIHSYFNGKNDIMVHERKISGNAFVSDKGMNCHHGTILINVDLEKLSEYLTVSPLKLQSKGIDSVTSRVMNLSEINPELTVGSMKESLIKSFNEFYKTKTATTILNEHKIEVAQYIEKYNSWEWNYSESPDFTVTLENRFDWGMFEMHLNLSDGRIKDCKIFTDSIEVEAFKCLGPALVDKKLEKNSVVEVICKCIEKKEIQQSLCAFLIDKIIV